MPLRARPTPRITTCLPWVADMWIWPQPWPTPIELGATLDRHCPQLRPTTPQPVRSQSRTGTVLSLPTRSFGAARLCGEHPWCGAPQSYGAAVSPADLVSYGALPRTATPAA